MEARPLRRLSQAHWLNRDRILGWSSVLLALQVAMFIFLVLWTHSVFVPIDPPSTTDFASFYAAGKLALGGMPALAYDQAAHYAAEVAATAPNIRYQFFFYPPVYLLLCAPLALLPYMVAYVMFQAATLGAWLLVMRRIIAAPGWAWCLPVLAYPAVFWTLGLGQNAFLTAALLGAMTLLLDYRPVLAGVMLGLMCYKPHLALLAPIALVAGGRWRTFAAAAVTVVAVVGVSVLLFGLDTWRHYLAGLAESQVVYANWRINLNGFVSPYGAARVLGMDATVALVVQGIAAIVVAALVAWIWWRDTGPALRSAALAAGMPLFVPVVLMYDLMLITVAIGWLVRVARRTGFLPWEKLVLFFCFLVPLVCRHLGEATHIPIGPLAPAALLAICLARTLRTDRAGTIDHTRRNIAAVPGSA
jgi:alpha-1,2-mannosyltransferase